MIHDDRIREALLNGGLASAEEVAQLAQTATHMGTSLYRAVLAVSDVAETDLVAYLSTILEVSSVSLQQFRGKPTLIALLPPNIVKRHRVLPVGLKDQDGRETLFLAMEDPHDLDALEAVGHMCSFPIVPLLAGPVDLDSAIHRVYSSDAIEPPVASSSLLMEEQTGPTDAVSSSPGDVLNDSGLFGDAFRELDLAQPSDMHSALSMLDDIPRNRHEEVTSPTGFDLVSEESTLGRAMSVSTRGSDTSFGRPAHNETGAPRAPINRSHSGLNFEASGINVDARPGMTLDRPGLGMHMDDTWRGKPLRQVVEAVVQVLIDRGVLTEEEIEAKLRG